nr:MAG TPA: LRV protein FeS4 cluster [Caudoviricetes sp.]
MPPYLKQVGRFFRTNHTCCLKQGEGGNYSSIYIT